MILVYKFVQCTQFVIMQILITKNLKKDAITYYSEYSLNVPQL